LRPKVHRCFEAGALATGAKIAFTGGDKPYAEMRHDAAMAAIYRRNSEALGRPFPNLGEWETRPTGSTDMGNISLEGGEFARNALCLKPCREFSVGLKSVFDKLEEH